MPKLDPAKLAPSEIYGKEQVDTTLTMGERIRKRFKPFDTVQVKNVDTIPIRWQWLPEDAESYVIDETDVKIVDRDDPDVWELEAGETDVLQGSCAYIMIEQLYKQLCVRKVGVTLQPLDQREIKNFAFDDPASQEALIDIIFIGKVTPQMMQEAARRQIEETTGVNTTAPAPTTATTETKRDRSAVVV